MNAESTQQRITNLYRMLFEMASGNLAFRIDESVRDDELGELVAAVNSVAEEMHSIILNAGFVNPCYHYQNLTQTTFILDKNFIIQSFSSGLPVVLGHEPEHLFKMNFEELLAVQVKPLWETIQSRISNDDTFHDTVQLLFLTANKQIIPSFCTISRLLFSDKIIISSITTILQDLIGDNSNYPRPITPRPSEAVIVQNVYDYIRNNLEEPLPATKELSKMFGTNEFALKDGFRHFFNTSIYQFYTEERLKKAHLLMQQTEIPLKEIAFMSGYNDYTNFYKAFKKKFSYSPSELKRPDIEDKTK